MCLIYVNLWEQLWTALNKQEVSIGNTIMSEVKVLHLNKNEPVAVFIQNLLEDVENNRNGIVKVCICSFFIIIIILIVISSHFFMRSKMQEVCGRTCKANVVAHAKISN